MTVPVIIAIVPQEDGRVRYVRVVNYEPRAGVLRATKTRTAQAVIIGFECVRHRFYVQSENADGILPLLEQFPSIQQSEDRIDFRFTDENEFFYFRMLWE